MMYSVSTFLLKTDVHTCILPHFSLYLSGRGREEKGKKEKGKSSGVTARYSAYGCNTLTLHRGSIHVLLAIH